MSLDSLETVACTKPDRVTECVTDLGYVDKSPVTNCEAVSHSDDSRPVLEESMVCPSKGDSLGTDQDFASQGDGSSPVLGAYKGFVSKGEVSSVTGAGECNSVTILRDTGATQSLMLSDAAPMFSNCEARAKALIQGIDGSYVPVPL